jgi:hypothetical protein
VAQALLPVPFHSMRRIFNLDFLEISAIFGNRKTSAGAPSFAALKSVFPTHLPMAAKGGNHAVGSNFNREPQACTGTPA